MARLIQDLLKLRHVMSGLLAAPLKWDRLGNEARYLDTRPSPRLGGGNLLRYTVASFPGPRRGGLGTKLVTRPLV